MPVNSLTSFKFISFLKKGRITVLPLFFIDLCMLISMVKIWSKDKQF